MISLSCKTNNLHESTADFKDKIEGLMSPTNAVLITYDLTNMHSYIKFILILSSVDNMWAIHVTIKLDILNTTSKKKNPFYEIPSYKQIFRICISASLSSKTHSTLSRNFITQTFFSRKIPGGKHISLFCITH